MRVSSLALDSVQALPHHVFFYHKERDIETVVHGDDFTSLATDENLKWFSSELSKVLKISDRGILGPEPHHVREIRLLNRILAWYDDGIRYEADQRHAEILIDALKLSDSKGVETPGRLTKDEEGDEAESESLVGAEVTAFRGCAARCNFLGLDRPDVQFAAKEISRNMAAPNSMWLQ